MTTRESFFANHAVEDLAQFIDNCRDMGMYRTAEFIDHVRFFLHMAIKFRVPDFGQLFDHGGLTQAEAELFQLPYPVIAAEYQCPFQSPEALGPPYATTPVYKRIALAFEATLLPENFRPERSPAVLMLPLNFETEHHIWVPNVSMLALYPGSGHKLSRADIQRIIDNDPDQQELVKSGCLLVTDTGWVIDQTTCFPGEMGVIARADMAKRGVSPRLTAAIDCNNERDAIIQLVAALQCSNVKTHKQRVEPPLQAKRTRSGKAPLYEYHVLTIPGGDVEAGARGQGGHHASPRLHLRRGHIRHLYGSHRPVWVQRHIVRGREGIVEKDYAIATK